MTTVVMKGLIDAGGYSFMKFDISNIENNIETLN